MRVAGIFHRERTDERTAVIAQPGGVVEKTLRVETYFHRPIIVT